MKEEKMIRRQKMDLILARLIAYYQVEMTQDTIELYHQMLSNFSIDSIRAAAAEHVKNSRWFPKISELSDIIKGHQPKIQSIASMQASHVLDMVRRCGYSRQPRWEDPITAQLMRSRFSWSSLCNSVTEDEEKWFLKEFADAYNAFSDTCDGKPELIEAPKELVGLLETVAKPMSQNPTKIDFDKAREKIKRRAENLKKYTPEEISELKRRLAEFE